MTFECFEGAMKLITMRETQNNSLLITSPLKFKSAITSLNSSWNKSDLIMLNVGVKYDNTAWVHHKMHDLFGRPLALQVIMYQIFLKSPREPESINNNALLPQAVHHYSIVIMMPFFWHHCHNKRCYLEPVEINTIPIDAESASVRMWYDCDCLPTLCRKNNAVDLPEIEVWHA